jgi:undecaprenyl-diphosphatase
MRGEIGPVGALFVVVALVLGFGALAGEVVEGDTTAFDRHILLLFRDAGDPARLLGPPWFQEMARDVTSLGSYALLGLILVVVLGYLLMVRKRGAAAFLGSTVVGGQILSMVLKDLFERPRPDIVPQAARVFTTSFPSAHAMLSAITYLTVGAVLSRFVPDHRLRVYVVSLAIFLTLLVGLSRVYLGVHWPTDVLAGWCVGSAWAILCWAIALWLQQAGTVETSHEPSSAP